MKRVKALAALVLVARLDRTQAANDMMLVTSYLDSACSVSPVSSSVTQTTTCVSVECSPLAFGNITGYFFSKTCVSSTREAYKRFGDVFSGSDYFVMDVYTDTDCSEYGATTALAVGDCEPYTLSDTSSATVTLAANGSAQLDVFANTTCTSAPTESMAFTSEAVSSHVCYQGLKVYVGTSDSTSTSSDHSDSSSGIASASGEMEATDSSTPATTGARNTSGSTFVSTSSSSSGLAGTTLAALIVGAAILALSVIGCVVYRQRLTSKRAGESFPEPEDSLAVLEPEDAKSEQNYRRTEIPTSCFSRRQSSQSLTSSTASSVHSSHRRTVSKRPWEEDVIVAARIPRHRVITGQALNRGGFGVVYAGAYNGQKVAVKMLLPETRTSIAHVVELLAEVKMMASMEHERIVRFIGVAWDSLTNICVVSEFMAGGDLKMLLSKFNVQRHPMGFGHDKIKIALHMAHALTYMHSLDPPVIHRDLKSRNVLLSEALDAKLTDFGTSRERDGDVSMTGGVGTCLWMAPEVMVGDRYDDKADMFSFGVVLSELDTHKSPYWYAKDSSNPERQIPEAAILQLVLTGALRVKFSRNATTSIVELGKACVSLDPERRPTASQALYTLHTALSKCWTV